MKTFRLTLLLSIVCIAAFAPIVRAQSEIQDVYRETARFKAYWATQGVAVDKDHFYAIHNTHITKFTKQGDSLTTWSGNDKARFCHLNYGIVKGRKLYCAHSNFPTYPMTSSVEIFDTKTMEHIGSHSFGIDYGSLTWIIPVKDGWYAFFAHYTRKMSKTPDAPMDNHNLSQLVKFDRKWRKTAAWTIPENLLAELGTTSLSGGILIGDVFYCTGHDSFEVYKLKIPSSSSSLEWIGKAKVPFYGQAGALDADGSLWGIIRKERVVVKGEK